MVATTVGNHRVARSRPSETPADAAWLLTDGDEKMEMEKSRTRRQQSLCCSPVQVFSSEVVLGGARGIWAPPGLCHRSIRPLVRSWSVDRVSSPTADRSTLAAWFEPCGYVLAYDEDHYGRT